LAGNSVGYNGEISCHLKQLCKFAYVCTCYFAWNFVKSL